MSLRDALRIPGSEITDEAVYRDRRRLLALLAATPALGLAGCAGADGPARAGLRRRGLPGPRCCWGRWPL